MVSKTLKKQINRFLLAFGFSLLIFGQSFRQTVGEAVGVLMNPLLALVGQENLHLVILAMAAITAIYASLIQKYAIDWDLKRNLQEHMKFFKKEFEEARLLQDVYRLKKLEDQRKSMMEDQMKVSKQEFKPMAYISIISTPFLIWIYYYISGHGSASIVFPFWGKQLLASKTWYIPDWSYWYCICSIGISQIIRTFLETLESEDNSLKQVAINLSENYLENFTMEDILEKIQK